MIVVERVNGLIKYIIAKNNMIELTVSETKKIKELAQDDKSINKLWQLYESYQTDPTLRYFLAYKKAIFEISSQLEKNANKFSITDNKDDKGFERTMKYMIESQKLIENLKYLEKQGGQILL